MQYHENVAAVAECLKIKNMLTRRNESNTYLATVSRHRWSPQIAMKVDKVCSFQLVLQPSSSFLSAMDLSTVKSFKSLSFKKS